MPNMQRMDPNIILSEIEAFAAKTGMKPSTICQNALGNARFYERLRHRVDRYAVEADRLREFMMNSSPSKSKSAT